MPVIVGGNIIEGGSPQSISGAGVPSNGTDEVQTITIGGTPEVGSTFRLTYDGWRTAAIAWSATDATLIANIDAALEALPNIGTGGVTVADVATTNGVGTMSATFVAQNGKTNVSLMVGSDFLQSDGTASTGTVSVATTTPGVTASGRGAGPGTRYNDYTNGVDYTNTGTAAAPVWSAVSVANVTQEMIDLAAAIPTAAVADMGAIANHTATTAIAGAYADLAAARTSVNTFRTDVEAALTELDVVADLLSDKIDALLAELRTAGIVTP